MKSVAVIQASKNVVSIENETFVVLKFCGMTYLFLRVILITNKILMGLDGTL